MTTAIEAVAFFPRLAVAELNQHWSQRRAIFLLQRVFLAVDHSAESATLVCFSGADSGFYLSA